MSWLDPLLAIKTQQAGTTAGTRQTINFASGATVVDDPANDRVDVTISDTGITQLTGDVTAGPGSGSIAATVAKVNGVSVSGTPTSGQVIRATSGTASSWANVARGDIANTSGATGDLITGNATTLGRLAIGSTGQVLTVSGGAPVWAASSPTTLWEADLTTGQTAGAWSVPSVNNVIVGSSGTGNLNWGTTNFAGTAYGVAMVGGSGLEMTAPASPSVNANTGVFVFLDQLNLSYFTGRPFRIWTKISRSGTSSVGATFVEQFIGAFGNLGAGGNPSAYAYSARGFVSDVANSIESVGFGTNRTGTPGNASWYSSDVFCLTAYAGILSISYGTYSSDWPTVQSLLTLNVGAIQEANLPSMSTTPYSAQSRFYFAPYVVGGGTFTNKKFIIQRIKIEGL